MGVTSVVIRIADTSHAQHNMTKFRLYNGSSEDLGSHIMLEYKTIGSDGSCCCSGPRIPPNEWTEMSLPQESFDQPVDQSSGRLKLRKKGLKFQGVPDDTPDLCLVADGGEYHVILDASCPPLSREEADHGMNLIRDLIEGRLNGISPPADARDKNMVADAWRHIASGIGRDGSNNENVKTIRDMLCDATCFSGNRKPWGLVYDGHPSRPALTASPEAALEVLRSGKYSVHVYHRALDRFPGGNADMHVIKQMYNAETQQATCLYWSNWDGQSYLLPKPEPLDRPDFSIIATPLEALFSSSPQRDILCTVDDDRMDSDEYDTEWSSIEVLLYNQNSQLVGHVHQRANLTRDRQAKDALLPSSPAEPPVQAVLDAVEQALHMGRVEAFSEGSVVLPGQSTQLAWHGYITPIFLGAGQE